MKSEKINGFLRSFFPGCLPGLLLFLAAGGGCSLFSSSRVIEVSLPESPGDVIRLGEEGQLFLLTRTGFQREPWEGASGGSLRVVVPRESTVLAVAAYPVRGRSSSLNDCRPGSAAGPFLFPLGGALGPGEEKLVLSRGGGWAAALMIDLWDKAPGLYSRFNALRFLSLVEAETGGTSGSGWWCFDEDKLRGLWEEKTMRETALTEVPLREVTFSLPFPGEWWSPWAESRKSDEAGHLLWDEFPSGSWDLYHREQGCLVRVVVKEEGPPLVGRPRYSW